jgi:cytochrome c oxidase subunit 2
VAVGSSVLLSGCANKSLGLRGDASSGWLPNGPDGGQVTDRTGLITNLWVGSWIAALGVGLLVWGLTIWVMVRYRRKKDDTGLPPQLRYNVPIEMLYTLVPVFMVAVLFYYTARDQTTLTDNRPKPDITVNVVAKQWSWDFNYVEPNTFEAGVHTQRDEKTGEATIPQPVLYLPQGKRVQFVLNSRDVVHSFWVPAFLEKLDVVPGYTNRFQIVPIQQGEFQGKCAELCGTYHYTMLFRVKVVPQAEFDAQMARLRDAGQTGQLPNTLNREPVLPEEQRLLPNPTGPNPTGSK